MLVADERFVVLDKPAGLKVHPGPGGGPSVEDWFALLSRRRNGPWLAHRLDVDTSGCLVIALRRAALAAAQACFASGTAGKTYWAVVEGEPQEQSGLIEAPLRRRESKGGWRMEPHAGGQPARTAWRLLDSGGGLSWLELRLLTGRTHQARVHCAAVLGLPILGDAQYGRPRSGASRPDEAPPPGKAPSSGGLHLLARSIALPLDPPLAATAPPPPHMRAALARCGWRA